MDVETGLNRLARVIEILGMIWAMLGALVSVAALALGETDEKWFAVVAGVVIGAIGYGLARAVAWIIRGFAQKRA